MANSRAASMGVYVAPVSPLLTNDQNMRSIYDQLTQIAGVLASTQSMIPQPATAAPAVPTDGMQRLARSPWRPVIGQTADAWVYFDGIALTWKPLVGGHSLKIPVCQRPDYDILYECWQGFVFVHCTVRRWSHRVRVQLLDDIEALHALIGAPVYAMADADDERHHKFLALCGFVCTGQAKTADGRPMLEFSRPLSNQPAA